MKREINKVALLVEKTTLYYFGYGIENGKLLNAIIRIPESDCKTNPGKVSDYINNCLNHLNQVSLTDKDRNECIQYFSECVNLHSEPKEKVEPPEVDIDAFEKELINRWGLEDVKKFQEKIKLIKEVIKDLREIYPEE